MKLSIAYKLKKKIENNTIYKAMILQILQKLFYKFL
jgi:hypothetical protein